MADIGKLLAKYERNRLIRALIQLLIPHGVGGAIDVVLQQTLQRMREERARVFFDELAKGNVLTDDALLKSNDFIHCYFSTARYALNTRRREKIEMFSRLLKSSVSEYGPKDVDEYEDFLNILDDFTYRELMALKILDEFSSRPRTERQNDLQWTTAFWDEFVKRVHTKVGVPLNEVEDFMNRISRTGCYEMFVGGYMDYTGGMGKLTPIYRRLIEFISMKKEG